MATTILFTYSIDLQRYKVTMCIRRRPDAYQNVICSLYKDKNGEEDGAEDITSGKHIRSRDLLANEPLCNMLERRS
ncbi:hypothetical protein KP509_35G058900 [Ceratopteris richardii]|uniref:Uncharacterized protein n=1 Tax=Ceratopteris richardii TaxID=49495 RepID=A0A8T2QIL1_CERRI|nr:hypothetical protein KP509_35G058900 [Ceratopteris richardii]